MFSKYKKGAKKEKMPMVSILKLFRFADRLDKVLLGIGMVAACASGVTMPLMTVIFSDLSGEFLTFNFTGGMDSEENRQTLDSETRKYCWYFLGLGLGTWVIAMVQKLVWGIASERIGKRVRERFYEAILRQEIGWFEGLSTGELTTRISGDVNVVQGGIGEKFSFVVQYVTTFVVGVILAFTKGWQLTLVVLAVLPVVAGSASLMGILLARSTSGGQDAYAAAGSVADEVLGSIKTVMAFGGEEREAKRYREKIEAARATGQRKAWVVGGSMGFIMFSVYSVYALGFWYGGKLVREGRMDAAEVLNAFFALLIGGFAIGNAAPSIAAVGSARGAAVAVFGVIDRKSAIDAVDTEHGCSADGVRGEITLRGVHFAYPTRPEVAVLRGMDVHVAAGQRVALVGESGSGKSTLVGLVSRLYDAEQGTVLVDGVDVREYNVRSLRQQMGVIMQTPVLFGQSIHRNIVWGATGDREPTRDEVVAACKAANAHDFISALPDGYDTLCGERGAQLSGGQKQRIAIARALIRNPRILLLDEATSALDSQSEAAVQQALDAAAHGRTTITVAHRLSTVRDADIIFVVSQGVVVEAGSHDQLLAQGGAYARLVEAQQLRQNLE
ncbi:ATP-binding cassette, sub-family B, member 4, partial [Coemansia reversa NRRL 1564]